MCTRKCYGLFVGYFNIVGGIIGAIVCIIMLVKHEEIATNLQVDKGLLCGIFIFIFIMLLITIGISSLLVTGIHKRRHGFMLPWIVIGIISVIISFILNIVMAVQGQQAAMGIILAIISLAIHCAIIYPIYTLYTDMKAQKMGNSYLGRNI